MAAGTDAEPWPLDLVPLPWPADDGVSPGVASGAAVRVTLLVPPDPDAALLSGSRDDDGLASAELPFAANGSVAGATKEAREGADPEPSGAADGPPRPASPASSAASSDYSDAEALPLALWACAWGSATPLCEVLLTPLPALLAWAEAARGGAGGGGGGTGGPGGGGTGPGEWWSSTTLPGALGRSAGGTAGAGSACETGPAFP